MTSAAAANSYAGPHQQHASAENQTSCRTAKRLLAGYIVATRSVAQEDNDNPHQPRRSVAAPGARRNGSGESTSAPPLRCATHRSVSISLPHYRCSTASAPGRQLQHSAKVGSVACASNHCRISIAVDIKSTVASATSPEFPSEGVASASAAARRKLQNCSDAASTQHPRHTASARLEHPKQQPSISTSQSSTSRCVAQPCASFQKTNRIVQNQRSVYVDC